MKDVKGNFELEKKIVDEISSLSEDITNSKSKAERRIISSQIMSLKNSLKKSGQGVIDSVEKISVTKPLAHEAIAVQTKQTTPMKKEAPKLVLPKDESKPIKKQREKATELEKLSLKRMKKKEIKVVKKKEKKPSLYVKMASKMFYKKSRKLISKRKFFSLRRDLIKANLGFIPANYIAVTFFTTLVSFFVSIFIMLFFLFFNLIVSPPFIVPVETSIGARFLQVFWIIFAIPALVYIFVYFYPTMEKKSIEGRINMELPFATIHMSSISGSMLEPSKIFSIIISTKEYVFLEKEFIKLLNEVNIYGYDLVTALRNMAFNSPSRKLADLYNGLATTINSGGDLSEFFDKRAQTLLFEHSIEVEKQSKAAETFLDIYISIVIAAPMILMLLLMMMRISGLGISLSTGMITLVMVSGVTLMNILFIAFLQVKQPAGA